ncbi:MAG: quinolinate synthase NadA [Candidatus Omnitrophica bacterium]|nr:quinolinate synthase NadA [Candidatus Omnitrophota bacterium]MBU4149723.1 quinolinate synthase NadA [Candidatus Omnitrophota bacterium]
MYNKTDDIKYKENLKKKIFQLKKERDAVIIVHNYQRDEIQDIADISGDSLALSQAAVRADAKVIVFCGVDFMAESASILNPDKIVLLPVKEAGCPMADMVTIERLRAKRKQHPDAAVVCYVNSSAAIKAESDVCCTSSNAIQIVGSLKDYKEIIFIPDKNLGRYVQHNIPDKKIILWEGFCPTHIRVSKEEVLMAKKEHPDAEILAHPECNPDVLSVSDHICSTGGMFSYVKNSKAKSFIIVTESGMLYGLKKANPDKEFYVPTERLVCPTMKLTTLGWVAHSLEAMECQIKITGDIKERAYKSLARMLKVSGEKSGAAISGV